MDKIVGIDDIKRLRAKLKKEKKALVFTNGCFDLIHRGHIEYLKKAKSHGDFLIVAVNSDSSVGRIKGKQRPLIPLVDRLYVLSHLVFIDFLISFDEDTPEHLIRTILPDVLVKGSDYREKEIVGADIVKANGGKVITIPFIKGKSSSEIIGKILQRYREKEK
jgi:D-beta-D-heptose 7-phosphate kinase/D-beta-D-heptose 1-phosphate adenosyltransferase